MHTAGWMARVVLGTALLGTAVACGGKQHEAKSTEAKVSSVDQIASISGGLQADLDAMMKPIEETTQVIDELSALPAKHNLNLGQVMGMAKASFDGGEVSISADFSGSEEAKAELEALLKRLVAIKVALQEIPAKAAALGKAAAEATAKVPALATKATAELNFVISSPMVKPEKKAQAQADLEKLNTLVAETNQLVSTVTAEVSGLPAKGTEAMAKLTASFAGGGEAKTANAEQP